jgi:CheY-specific phosphatase CheX
MAGARAIGAGMLCIDSPDQMADEELADAMGEIANMVMGAVKTRIQDDYQSILISVPSVVQGRELRRRPNDGMVQIVASTRVGGLHQVEFSLTYREAGAA